MAQNITLLGASYSDVPSVTLPKTGGGTASFDDTTDANATASDIAEGKTAYVNGEKLVGTASGGGGGSGWDDPTDFSGGNILALISHGTEYINTGYTGSLNGIFSMKFSDSNVTNYEGYFTFCNGNNNIVGLQRNNNQNVLTMRLNSNGNAVINLVGYGTQAIVSVVFSTIGTTPISSATKPLLIGGSYYRNAMESQLADFTFYGLNVLNENGQYVARWFPWLENGVPCVKDILNNTIFYNAGTGTYSYIDLDGVTHNA